MSEYTFGDSVDRVREIIARWAAHREAGLLPCLQEIQSITGWLSPEVCRSIAEGLRVPLAHVYGVISFYSLLYHHPVGRVIVRVCDDALCYLNGSQEVLAALENHLGIRAGQTTPDGKITLEVHPCLGRCERAPFTMVNEEEYGPVRQEEVSSIIEQIKRQAADGGE